MPFSFSFRKSSRRSLNISSPLSKSELERLVPPASAIRTSVDSVLPVDDTLPQLQVSTEFRMETIKELEKLMIASTETLVASETVATVGQVTDGEKRYGIVFDDDSSDDIPLHESTVQFEEPAVICLAMRKRPTRVMRPLAYHLDRDVPLASPHLVVDTTPVRRAPGL